jgi:large subunit ribosomal protein L10
MNRDQKSAVIDEIAASITDSQAIFAVDYRGITVEQAKELRSRLRESNATLRVVKNSLTERAADKAGTEQLKTLLAGPTALTFVRGDGAAAAKSLADFGRTTQLLAFKGGLMDGAVLSAAEITSISRLPSRDVLYGQLVGLVANPITSLARTLNALIAGVAVQLGGVLAQREAAGETVTPPAAEPTPEAATEKAVVAEDSASEPAAEPGAPEASEAATEEAPAATTPEEESPGEPTAERSDPEASSDETPADETAADEAAHQSEDAPADASTPDTN